MTHRPIAAPPLLALSALLALAGLPAMPPASGQVGYPMVTAVYPVGLKRGTSAELTVSGAQNLAGAYAVQFEGAGLTAEVLQPIPAPKPDQVLNEVRLKVTASPDAALGTREFRVITPRGASSVGLLVVGSLPEFLETEPNNTVAQANAFQFPATLEGRIQAAEDVDCYRFEANAGDEVVFSCLSGRLQDRIHDLSPGGGGAHSDPVLVLTDDQGRELDIADDWYGPDPLMAHKIAKTGSYVLQIRDVRYQGHPGWTYQITATRSGYLTGVYPMAGERGKSVAVQPVGFGVGGMAAGSVTVPMQEPGEMELQLKAGEGASNPVPFLISDLPQTLEAEGNDDPAHATPAALPGGYSGRIGKPNDRDLFRVHALKGKSYTFEARARRYGSSLDPVLQILDMQGRALATNDDAEGWDSRVDWNCPVDGDYLVEVTDLNSRGGDTFTYSVEGREVEQDFSLKCDDDKALIGAGGGYAMYVMATRKYGFAGEIKLAVEGLPPGVTVAPARIPANMTTGCLVFNAPAGAKPAFSRIRVSGSGEGKKADGSPLAIRREARPMEEIYMPGGGRSVYPVDLHTVSVTEPADVALKLSANTVTLKPGGSVTINVDVTRQNGYAKNVVLDVSINHLGQIYANPLPPGVTLDGGNSKTLLGPTETKGRITLKAAGDAPEVENLPIAILGQISINFVVKVSHASEPVALSVRK